ncbi:MAG: hypothetical protein ACMXYG_05565 [Candidatus Woesearchaeota archaeon]
MRKNIEQELELLFDEFSKKRKLVTYGDCLLRDYEINNKINNSKKKKRISYEIDLESIISFGQIALKKAMAGITIAGLLGLWFYSLKVSMDRITYHQSLYNNQNQIEEIVNNNSSIYTGSTHINGNITDNKDITNNTNNNSYATASIDNIANSNNFTDTNNNIVSRPITNRLVRNNGNNNVRNNRNITTNNTNNTNNNRISGSSNTIERVVSNNQNQIVQRRQEVCPYENQINQIRLNISNGRYNVATEQIQNMERRLRNSQNNNKEQLIQQLANITYTKRRYVPEQREQRLVQEGYFKDVWVKPVTERRRNKAGHALNILGCVVSVTTGGIFDPGNIGSNGLYKEVTVREGYYQKEWVEPVYENVLIPAHYLNIQVTPLTGAKRIIGRT